MDTKKEEFSSQKEEIIFRVIATILMIVSVSGLCFLLGMFGGNYLSLVPPKLNGILFLIFLIIAGVMLDALTRSRSGS